MSLGAAYVFERVGCYGLGVGSGSQFRTAQTAGWPQWQDDRGVETIDDEIGLCTPSGIDDNSVRNLILTVTNAAAESSDCAHRLKYFPMATAEDMEAFGVAVACKLRGIPLTVVRGISNHAGDRDKNNWQVEPALQSVAEIVRTLLTD